MSRYATRTTELVLIAMLAFLAIVPASFSSPAGPPRHAARVLGVTKDSPRPLVCIEAVDALHALAGAPGGDSARVRYLIRQLAERACWR